MGGNSGGALSLYTELGAEGGSAMRRLTTALVAALLLVGTVTGPAAAALPASAQSTGVQTNDHLEPNDNFGDASQLFGNHGQLQIVNGEYDYFRVHLQQGEQLETSLDFSHSDGDLDLVVYSSNQQIIASSLSTTDGERVSVTAPSTGVYYVAVNGYNGSSAPYYISADIENNDRFEHNDNRTQATDRVRGNWENLSIVGGESDFYAIPLNSGEQLDAAIDFDHSVGDLDMRIRDPSGNVMVTSQSVSDDESASITATQDARYYVEVYGFNGASAPYNLTLSSPTRDDGLEDNDGTGTATSSRPYLQDMQVTPNDPDYFEVDLQRGEQLTTTVSFDHTVGDLDVRVTDPQGNFVASSTSTSDDEQLTVTASQSGTYYVKVYGHSGAANAYDMQMETQNDRFEYNNGISAATPISPGQHGDLNIENGESDYYAIQLQQGETLDADAYFAHSDGDLDMRVYDPSGNEVGLSWSTTDDESITHTASTSGTYYVEMRGFDGASAPYALELQVQ